MQLHVNSIEISAGTLKHEVGQPAVGLIMG